MTQNIWRPIATCVFALCVAVYPNTSAHAQSFNAGARSLGLGGSFQALADDVTSVFWNPAGAATLGIQVHSTIGGYQRIDENGRKDLEPVPGPAFIGLSYGIDEKTAIVGGYFTPFVNERTYLQQFSQNTGLSFRELQIEQFFNRLSLGFARQFRFTEDVEGFLTELSIGGTADLSISSTDGQYLDSAGRRDIIQSRKVAPGFTLGVLLTLIESQYFDVKFGLVYHHQGNFDLRDEGFEPLAENAQASRLYRWPRIYGGGISFRLLENKALVFLVDYQYIEWESANHFLENVHNVSFGVEYAYAVDDAIQVVGRFGGRRLEEPSHDDPLSRGIDDHILAATFGIGLTYQPRLETYYAASFALEVGDGINFALSFTLGF